MVKLHWKEAKSGFQSPSGRLADTVWTKISRERGNMRLDKERLEQLFELRAVEKTKKAESTRKELTVLDIRRSCVINIGLRMLPPPDTIKAAILKMDSTVINRESIEKILLMMPTNAEKTDILHMMSNSELPLGSAEQFLLTLSSISELPARLNLWAFTLDYKSVESEIVETMSDLKVGIEELQHSHTFEYILGMTLSVGNFLNGSEAEGFIIDYLAMLPDVKDTVHKQSLLYHLTNMILDQFPDASDLYSDIGAISRCAKVDWDMLMAKLAKLETDCKTSWDHLRAIVKHDISPSLKSKLSDILVDSTHEITKLKIIYRRLMNRFHKFLLYLGYSSQASREAKVCLFCKTVTDFALKYRVIHEKLMRKRVQGERRKTLGKMIVEMDAKSRTLSCDVITEDDVTKLENQVILPGAKARKQIEAQKQTNADGAAEI